MKKTKIVASIVLAAALGTATFAACGGGKKPIENNFELANYAHALDSDFVKEGNLSLFEEENTYNKAYTAVTTKTYKSLVSTGSSSTWAEDFGIATVEDSEGNQTKTLYNVKTGAEVLTGYSNITASSSQGTTIYQLTKQNAETSETEYYLAGPDGKLLFTAVQKNIGDCSCEIEKEVSLKGNVSVTYYKVTYVSEYAEEGENKTTEVFFKQTHDDPDYTWATATEKEVEDAKNYSEYGAGTAYAERESVLDFMGYSDEEFPKSQLVGYEFSMLSSGSVLGLTLFKDGEKKASLEINNGRPLTVVGSYVYYYEMIPVDSEAKSGYELEIVSGGAVEKYDYQLYRYDFINVAEKPEEVKSDYVFIYNSTQQTSLYNYTADSFDRAYLMALVKNDGVAIVTDSSVDAKELVLDEDFKPVADMSGKAFSPLTYKLNDNAFFVRVSNPYSSGPDSNHYYVIDKDYTVLSEFATNYDVKVWEAENLIAIPGSSNGYSTYLFLGYDGKVAIETVRTTNSSVYGNTMAVNVSGTTTLYNKANPSGIEPSKLVKATEEEDVAVAAGAIFKLTPKDETLMTATITVYDLSGKQIGKIDDVLSVSVNTIWTALQYNSVTKIGEKLVFSGVQTKTGAEADTVTQTYIVG